MISNTSKEEVAKGRTFTQQGAKSFNGEDYMNILSKTKCYN